MLIELLKSRYISVRYKDDIQNIKSKMAQCELTPLSKGQKNDIQQFYRRMLGQEVPTYWHEYFYSRNGNFSVKYIPTCVYHQQIIYKLNQFGVRHAYVDKGLYDIYFPDVNRPQTVVKNMNGYYYAGTKPVSREEALEICRNLPAAVSKPSTEGMWGKGVKVFSTCDGRLEEDGRTVAELFNDYGKNFIIQERIEQHEVMSKLNPTSLNTLRVLSYRDEHGVHILYMVVRIGRAGKSVDNETAGGINADIDMATGTILDCAYGTPAEKRIETTDCGTTLKGFAIPAFNEVVTLVKALHLRLPYFNLIGWDFGIDKSGAPVLIEWNRAPDLSQTAHGPAFGDMTEEILLSLKNKTNTILNNL
jgi:hypothetical protein